MTDISQAMDWRRDEDNLLKANQEMLSFKQSQKDQKQAKLLKAQQSAAYRRRNPNLLHLLASVAEFTRMFIPDTLGFDTVDGLKLKKRHKWVESEMKEHDRQVRQQKLQLMRENSIWFAPARMIEAHQRNEECMKQIAAMDPVFGRRLKKEGPRAIFESEYGKVLEFMQASPSQQRRMNVEDFDIQNPGVKVQLRRIQENPSLAAALRRENPAESLANLSLTVRGKNPMVSRESQFGDKREAKRNLDKGRLAHQPEPKPENKQRFLRRGWGPVKALHKRYKPTPGYGRSHAPRPF